MAETLSPDQLIAQLADLDDSDQSGAGAIAGLKAELDALAQQLRAPVADAFEEEPAFRAALRQARAVAAERFALDSTLRIDTETPTLPSEAAAATPRAGRYLIQEEIARGGMGVVLRGLDPSFGRSLAVKMLLPKYAGDAIAEKRLLEEARVTGRLQHPGVAPVHELGRLEDGRPYFAMKLIEGRTLAHLLHDRADPGENLPHFVGVFLQICQTMAYAHSLRIIHRDLKPSNIMVGAFGEVQVMDWGLAKDVREPSVESFIERPAAPLPPEEVDWAQTLDEVRTKAGAVLGTPGYMAPEQAKGNIAALDERCDVFGLGAILCEILTGKPPFLGEDALAQWRQAWKADISEAFARLDACGADAELVQLAKHCLAPRKENRPAHAGALAQTIDQHQSALQERLRQVELERTAAQVRAGEERKRRRVGVGLAVVSVLLVTGAAAALLWYQHDRAQQHEARLQRQNDEASRHALLEAGMHDALLQARRLHADLGHELAQKGGVFKLLNAPERWQNSINAARSQWQRAVTLGKSAKREIGPALRDDIAALDKALAQSVADRELALRLEAVHDDPTFLSFGTGPSRESAEKAYGQIFAAAGFDLSRGKEMEFVARVRQSSIKEQLVVALDKFAWLAWSQHDRDRESHLLMLGRLADPGPIRDEFRNAGTWANREQFKQMLDRFRSDSETMNRLSPHMIYILGNIAYNIRAGPLPFLRESRLIHPDDFWINYLLGIVLNEERDPEAAGFFRAAVALRPSSSKAWSQLAFCHMLHQELAEAASAYEKALEISPEYVGAWINLGNTRRDQGDLSAAISAYQEALKRDPRQWYGWLCLGHVLEKEGNSEGALAALEKVVEISPTYVLGQTKLIRLLLDQGKFAAAETSAAQGVTHFPKKRSKGQQALLALRDEARRLKTLDARLTAVVATGAMAEPAELVELADHCCRYKRRDDRDAVKLYASAFASKPRVAEDLVKAYRQSAARAAVRAASNIDKPLPADEQAKLRQQARDWLKSDLTAWRKRLEAEPSSVLELESQLERWNEPELALVRSKDRLDSLPAEERLDWTKLWDEAEQLVKNTRSTEWEIAGLLTARQPTQTHTLTMSAGNTYVIDMQAPFDAQLQLQDATGKTVATGASPEGAQPIRIHFTPRSAGVYRITATSLDKKGRGGYQLSIQVFSR